MRVISRRKHCIWIPAVPHHTGTHTHTLSQHGLCQRAAKDGTRPVGGSLCVSVCLCVCMAVSRGGGRTGEG
eukprot:3591843-Rhodomonas_salina.2